MLFIYNYHLIDVTWWRYMCRDISQYWKVSCMGDEWL